MTKASPTKSNLHTLAAIGCALVIALLFADSALADAGELVQSDTFAAVERAQSSTAGQVLATDDFDGDGVDDVAVVSGTSNQLSVLLGEGDGELGAPTNYSGSASGTGSSEDLASEDLDDDGSPDLVVSGAFGVSVLLNQGDGTFDPPTTPANSGGVDLNSVSVGDFNADDEIDVVAATGSSSGVRYYEGDGSGALGSGTNVSLFGATGMGGGNPQTGQLIFPGLGARGADMDGDGFDDIVLASTLSAGGFYRGVAVIGSNGDGTFGAPRFYQAGGAITGGAAAGDINGDGAPDLAVSDIYNDTYVFRNLDDGAGTLSLSDSFAGPFSGEITFADFDLDGLDDLLQLKEIPDAGRGVGIAFSNGDGTLADPVGHATTASAVALGSGDFDEDDYPDVVSAGETSAGTDNGSVLLNQPAADLSATLTESADPVAVGDDYSYQLEIDNAGPDAATRVEALIAIPAEASYDDAGTDADNGDDICDATPGGTDVVSCELDDIDATDSGGVTIDVTADTRGTAIAEATVLAAVQELDPSDNTDGESTTLTGPAVRLNGPGAVDEDEGTATFTAFLEGNVPATGDVSFSYSTRNGTAAQPGDYGSTSGTATIQAGQTSVEIDVPIVDDQLPENDESFYLDLSSPSTGAVIASGTDTATITDDDPPAPVTVAGPQQAATEGDAGTTTMPFTVTVGPTARTVSVHYTAVGSGAVEGEDFNAAAGDLIFEPGETTETVNVTVRGDELDEFDEIVVLSLSAPTNATIPNGQGMAGGTIADDDDPPAISIADVSVAEGNSGETTATFDIDLDAPSGKPVTVRYASADETAKSAEDYVAEAGELGLDPGVTGGEVTISVKPDAIEEPDETFFVNLEDPRNTTIAIPSGEGTIRNDDSPPETPPSTPPVTPPAESDPSPGQAAGDATVEKVQEQKGSRIKVQVGVSCQENCTATGTGSIAIAGGGKGRVRLAESKPIRLSQVTTQVDAGQSAALVLKVKSKKQAKSVAKALKAGKRVKAKVSTEIKDAFGNVKTSSARVRLG